MPPVVNGLSSATTPFAEQRLHDRSADPVRHLEHFGAGAETAASGQDDHPGAGIQQVGGLRQPRHRRHRPVGFERVGAMAGNIRRRSRFVTARPLLHVFGNGQVRHRAATQRRFHRGVDDVDDMGRAHDPFAVRRDVAEEAVKVHVLLGLRADQVVEGVAVIANTGWPSHLASYSPFRR